MQPNHQVLQVKAVDGDRGIGNPITYSITGGADHLFAINKLNGLVYANVTFISSSFHIIIYLIVLISYHGVLNHAFAIKSTS